MARAWDTFVPPVTCEQAIAHTAMDGLAELLFQRLLYLGGGRDLSFGCTREEGRQQGLFGARGHVFPPPSPLPRRVQGCRTTPIVGGDDEADGGNGDAGRPGNTGGRPGINEGMIDNSPAATLGGIGGLLHLRLYLRRGEM